MTFNEYLVLIWLHVYGMLPSDDAWVRNARDALQSKNMIIRQGDKIEISDRGNALLDHMAKLPLPISTWRMP